MFCSPEEFKSILSGNIDDFNEVLSRVHNKALEDAMKATPELTARLIKSSLALQTMVTDYKAAHKEFAGYEDVMAKVLQEVELANPGAVYSTVLDKAVPIIQQRISSIKNLPTVQTEGQLSLSVLDQKAHGAL